MDIGQINETVIGLRQIASTPNLVSTMFTTRQIQEVQERVLLIAHSVKPEKPQLAHQLLLCKDNLFLYDIYNHGFINPVALGQIIFGLDYLVGCHNESSKNVGIWSFIHPEIRRVSEGLYTDGYYAEAAERAFVEYNSRAKKLFCQLKPDADSIPDGVALMNQLFSEQNPLAYVSDVKTESGRKFHQGFRSLSVGAIAALRNPNAHSNEEVLTGNEAMRRLMFASILMYRLDEAVPAER